MLRAVRGGKEQPGVLKTFRPANDSPVATFRMETLGLRDVLFHFGAVDATQSTVCARPVLSLGHTLSTRHYIFWPFTTTGRWQSWDLSAGR